jgi:hypothetical protein
MAYLCPGARWWLNFYEYFLILYLYFITVAVKEVMTRFCQNLFRKVCRVVWFFVLLFGGLGMVWDRIPWYWGFKWSYCASLSCRWVWNIGGMTIGRENLKYLKRSLSQCHFVHLKPHMDSLQLHLDLHGEELVTNHLSYCVTIHVDYFYEMSTSWQRMPNLPFLCCIQECARWLP